MDLVKWLENIRDSINFGFPMVVWVGFSFLMKQMKTQNIIYIYGCRDLAYIQAKPLDKVCYSNSFSYNLCYYIQAAWDKFVVEPFRGQSEYDLLMSTFTMSQDENPFAESGFIPSRLTAAYCWIL